MNTNKRLDTYSTLATELTLLSDKALFEYLEKAQVLSTSIGGTTMLLEISGKQVFVKKILLTDVERKSENCRSTLNLFELPNYYQYGIGSVGFGAWRELAIHAVTTTWILAGACPNFPLLYHWRLLSCPIISPTPAAIKKLKEDVEYWEGSPAIHARLQAIQNVSANVILFLEYIPMTLNTWLEQQITKGDEALELAVKMVEYNCNTTTSFINSRGLLHFDAHFKNILTDGNRLYFTDFGLAMYSGFELSNSESDFFEIHQNYDKCYTMTHLVNWLVTKIFGAENRVTVLQEYATGKVKKTLTPILESIIKRYAPLAVLMNDFYQTLQTKTRILPYPSLNEFELHGAIEKIKTRNLKLRPPKSDDSTVLFDLWKDEKVRKFLGGILPDKIIKEKMTSLIDHWNIHGFGQWVVSESNSNLIVGICGLHYSENGIELSYMFFPKFWGQGYATEAALASLAYGFNELKLDQIYAITQEANRNSCRLLENIGMHHIKNTWQFNTNQCIYTLTQNEWLIKKLES